MDIFYTELAMQILHNIEKRYSIGSIFSKGGRNMLGRICVHHKGAGNKRLYRKIDYFRRLNQGGSVLKVIKDAFRSGFIGLIIYFNGVMSQIILSDSNKIGSVIYSGSIYKAP